MDRDARPADAAHAMTTVLRYQRDGRFGRALRGEEPQRADVTATIDADAARERSETAGYAIDAHAVAAAIVERLLAGRTIAIAPQKRR
jgi:hypothetical protein